MVSGAAGAGLYINQKNDSLFAVSLNMSTSSIPLARAAGAIILAANVEDAGLYVSTEAGGGGSVGWKSGSASITVGVYKSVEDAKGPYFAGGASFGVAGINVGGDLVKNTKGETIGEQGSVGVGVGGAEGHVRFGITGIISIKDILKDILAKKEEKIE